MSTIRGSVQTKDDKKVKDACDIYALIWHSKRPSREIINSIKQDHSELVYQVRDHFPDNLIMKASYHLGVDPEQFMGVISQLTK